MDKDLEIAIYFNELEGENMPDFPVYYAQGVIIGKSDKDERCFTEYLTGRKYLNLFIAEENQINEGFNFVAKIKELKAASRFKKLNELYKSIWSQIEGNLYFFIKNEEGNTEFMTATVNEFNTNLGTNIILSNTNQINEMVDLLLDGTTEDFIKYLDNHPEYREILQENGEEEEQEEYKVNRPISETIEEMKKYIISQDEAIKKIVIAIYKNIKFDNPAMKSNILMYGPTGSGKTAIINTLSKVFDLPVWVEDMTRFTETGYKGADIDDILVNLYNNAEGDLQRAQRSILFLDEIDKKASEGEEKSFNKSDVLKSLLKIVEGGKFEIEINQYQTVTFDTSKLTVIVGGAFTELYNKREVKKDRIKIGFGLSDNVEAKPVSKEITIKDFEKYGMPIEFLGRFKTIVRLNELSLDDMVKILKDSQYSALKNYIETFEQQGITLEIPETIYKKIAEKAYEYHTGARSLNIVVDKIFEPILYEYFNGNDVEAIEVLENILEEERGYRLTKKNNGFNQQLTIPGFEL